MKEKKVFNKVKNEVEDIYLIASINAKLIPMVAYPVNICNFIYGEMNKLNQIIK